MSKAALSFLPVFIVPIALMVIGGLHAGRGILLFLRRRLLKQFGKYTSGTVNNVNGWLGDEDALIRIVVLRVEFKTEKEQVVNFKELLYTRENYKPGHWVPVTYDAENPQRASIGAPERLTGWLKNLPPIAIGALIFTAGSWFFIELLKLLLAI